MKRALQLLNISFWATVVLVLTVGNANAGTILLGGCVPSHLSATGYGNADACIGLLDQVTPGAGPNDDPDFFNNALLEPDATVIWDSNGAFGINNWSSVGKDDGDPGAGEPTVDLVSGDPASWSVDSPLLNQSYLFAIKQSTQLNLFKFDSLTGLTAGFADINAMFGSGTGDGGWSHFSVYTAPGESVPEPGILSLLGIGLLGLALSRRRLKS